MKYGFRLRLAIAPMAAAVAGVLCLTAGPASAASGSAMLNDGSGWCMGITSSGNAGQFGCTGAANQTWMRADVISGSPTIFKIENGSSQCLYAPSATKGEALKGGSTAKGAAAVLWTSTGAANQRWLWTSG